MSFARKAISSIVKQNERMFQIFFAELRDTFRSSFVCRDRPCLGSQQVNTRKDISVSDAKSSSAKMPNFCASGH